MDGWAAEAPACVHVLALAWSGRTRVRKAGHDVAMETVCNRQLGVELLLDGWGLEDLHDNGAILYKSGREPSSVAEVE
ncbi:hypothetical protein PtrV1_06646 [Pyrenophora tritici-repentis]|uniref:Uncharacterized protein n=2 Tax=Pyrenophora tritici-repentis TaxID=45151 RepID=A0A5M9L8L1_9PLEO|nr:uncharacterized protein PTRG_04355 [Pyrenophora tritici-repentis Pt-1C-BFP]KAA8619552.1 hypothetical protein PtrV1_06646 [Pyrenophora tritici-repentis]EDU47193.1 predicted protein [Pyrenophora tritici-repentis Pt-1C-BFP]KAF7447696.1 hypothetical protein A1F99_070600 [Pyrenophora tritici-repentis]KAF7571386.1 hypothetical protein PtrM4_088860 [Pyrenophora tritici-repentis]KAI0585352.1 hypothetical protein Alg215_02583 [Pyrenophora tritici-repentis]